MPNVNGNPTSDALIQIDCIVDNNTVTVSHVFVDGATTTIKDDPAGSTLIPGNIIPWTTY